MAIETMQEIDGYWPNHQAAFTQESPTIITSPYPDVEVPEVSLPAFVLEQAEERGDVPAMIDGLTGHTLTYRDLLHPNSKIQCCLFLLLSHSSACKGLFCSPVHDLAERKSRRTCPYWK